MTTYTDISLDVLQTAGNAILTAIESETSLRDLGSDARVGGTGASQTVSVPSDTKMVFVSSDYINPSTAVGEDGYTHLGIDETASALTSPVVYPRGYVSYPLDDTATLALFATANTLTYVRFLG